MKYNIYAFLSIVFFILLTGSCKKQEVEQSEPAKVVKLTINGSTTEDLEFIYKDSVIETGTAAEGKFVFNRLISVSDQNAAIKIRKKGSSEILETRTLNPSLFNQTIDVYYDGKKIYTSAVDFHIKGYALSGELEFLLDGNIIASGTGVINHNLNFGIDKNGTREIQVRKKDETAILITKTITATPAQQSLGFLFDGTNLIDNVKLEPPVNPANMAVTAKFETIYPDMFKGVDVDLVFYVRNILTGTITKSDPEIRITLPANGAFTSFELPPLPNATDYQYKFDIYEKGTNTIPYNTSSLPAAYPVKLNAGVSGAEILVEAGKSKLWLIKDMNRRVFSPAALRATYFYGSVTDLSQYFQ